MNAVNTATRTGILVGTVLALTWLVLGFWPFVLVAVAMTIGALVGRVIEGSLNLSALADVLTGRRTSS